MILTVKDRRNKSRTEAYSAIMKGAGMRDIHLLPMKLHLFGEGDGSSGDGAAAQGETIDSSRKAKNELSNVIYGKQEAPETVEADGADAAPNEEDLEKEFRDLVKGKYKGQYTKATQELINKRFSETKSLEKANKEMQEVMDVLRDRYKTEDTKTLLQAIQDDNDLWQEAADEEGLTVEQYKKFMRLERQEEKRKKEDADRKVQAEVDRQMKEWFNQGEALKNKFPTFDLQNEIQNPRFLSMLRSGVDVETAFKAAHMDEIMTDAMRMTQQETEKKVTDGIRAKGNRPLENGSGRRSAFTVKSDVTKLTKEDRAEIARRAAGGEHITF